MCCKTDHIDVGKLGATLLWRILVLCKSKSELWFDFPRRLAYLGEGYFAPLSKSCHYLIRGHGERYFDLDVVVVFDLCDHVGTNALCLFHGIILSSSSRCLFFRGRLGWISHKSIVTRPAPTSARGRLSALRTAQAWRPLQELRPVCRFSKQGKRSAFRADSPFPFALEKGKDAERE